MPDTCTECKHWKPAFGQAADGVCWEIASVVSYPFGEGGGGNVTIPLKTLADFGCNRFLRAEPCTAPS